MQAPTATTRKPSLKKGSKPYIFHIESKSRPGVFHVTDAYHMTCTCEAGRARRLCWHVRLAVQAYDWFKRQQIALVQRPSVPPAPSVPAPVAQQTTEPMALWSLFE